MIKFYNLGEVSWWESQCYYHALAESGREGLIICRPASPYVCLGLHDDLEQEIDIDYCRQRSIPLLRRETGGGVVYLDRNQIFFQLVLRRDNPNIPLRRDRFYQRFLRPAVQVYRQLGMEAAIRVPADITVAGRKCSGNAAGDIGNSVAYVGNLLLDFDYSIMSHVLKVPSEGFRYLLERVMRDNMTTMQDYGLNDIDFDLICQRLGQEFALEFGGLDLGEPDEELRSQAVSYKSRLTARDWLLQPGRRNSGRRVKIAEGIYLLDKGGTIFLSRNGSEEEIDKEALLCSNGVFQMTENIIATICG